MEDSLVQTHPFKNFPPVRSKPAAITKIYWGGADGGKDPSLWENVIETNESVGLRKLTDGVIDCHSTQSIRRYLSASKLLDGQLPADGWRSTWTAGLSQTQLTFNLGKKRK